MPACRGLTAEHWAAEKWLQPATRVAACRTKFVRSRTGVRRAWRKPRRGRCGDFIIRRSDGVFALPACGRCGRRALGVTEVVRGATCSPPRRARSGCTGYSAFRRPRSSTSRCSATHDGRKLSKRDEDLTSVGCAIGSPRAGRRRTLCRRPDRTARAGRRARTDPPLFPGAIPFGATCSCPTCSVDMINAHPAPDGRFFTFSARSGSFQPLHLPQPPEQPEQPPDWNWR